MPQIKKSKNKKLLFASGLVAGAPMMVAQVASADTVVHTDTSGAGQTTFDDTSNTPNQSVVNDINSAIRNLQTQSNGIVQISSTPKIVNDADVAKTKAAIAKLSAQIEKYNALKAELDAQNQTNQSINGMAGADNDTNVTGANLDITSSNMDDLLSKMQSAVDANKAILAENTQGASQSNAVSDRAKADNQQITNSASGLKHFKDGIIGNLDDVKRKSDDSAAANGIIVDNSATQQVNTVTTEAKIKDKMTQVKSIDEADANLNRILANIKAQNDANIGEASKSADYKKNAIANIDDINAWLKSQQSAAADAKKVAEASTTSISIMDDYKSKILDSLNKAMQILKDKGANQKRIDQVQKAIDTVNASGITKTPLPPVGSKDPIEFGDIGQKQDVANGSQDNTIANTKEVEAKKLADAIKNGVDQVKDSNAAAASKIQPTIDKNNKAMSDFLKALSKGGAGSQIDKEYLDKMPIYTSNDTPASKDFYKSYLDNALAQTQESVDQLEAQIANNSVLSPVSGHPSIAAVSAAMYAHNAGTMGDGFGSVMLPSTNINDIITKVAISNAKNAVVFADSRTDGGAEAVYNALLHMPGYAIKGNDYSTMPALRDLYNQYLHPKGATDPYHARNTFTLVTNSPIMSFELPKSFVYSDKNGNAGAATIRVTVSATAYNGDDISTRLAQNVSTASGTYALYLYNLQVNPYTGQLVTGVSYIPMQGTFEGTLPGGAIASGGGGEMNLGFEAIGSPVGPRAANGVGLAQAVKVQVDPNNADAIKYAQHAPLFVSDIDDKQQLIAYTGSNTGVSKIVTSEGQSDTGSVSDWTNPYKQSGATISMVANNKAQTDGTKTKTTNLGSQSAAVYKIDGSNQYEAGMVNSRVILRSKGDDAEVDGFKNNYSAIDTSVFAPFGIVGTPSLTLDQINAEVKTLEVNIPTAKAETKGTYHITSELEYLYGGTHAAKTPQNMSGEFKLPSFIPAEGDQKKASSNTSIVVKQREAISKISSSGNSMTVKSNSSSKNTSSGNSLIIKSATTKLTGSGNSFIIRGVDTKGVITGSGNSLTVRTLADAAKNNDETAMKLTSASPVVTKNADGTQTVSMTVYTDPTLLSVTKAAMDNWYDALSNKGVKLNISYTTDIDTLHQGVTLAVFEADDSNETIGSYQLPDKTDPTMKGLGGISTMVSNDVLTPDGENDVFNKSGNVKAGEALRNSLFTIQLNTQGLETLSFKNALLGGKLNEYVLEHEIGHVFGLSHDDADSLMTPATTNHVFNGKISDSDADKAAKHLVTSPSTSPVLASARPV